MNCIAEYSANVHNYLTLNTKQHTFKLVKRLNGPKPLTVTAESLQMQMIIF